VTDEAIALHRQATGWEVELAVGRRLAADQVILAIGNFPPARSEPGIYGDPWDPRALDQLHPAAPVLLIGTGLTMVDTVISLIDRGHRGPIHAVSRRGQLPRMHGAVAQPWRFAEPPTAKSLRKLVRQVRETVQEAEASGADWRAVIDGLRPHTQRLWLEMSALQRRRFLRHLRPWWDVHRHRAAPRIHTRLQDAIDRGQLMITAARLGKVALCIGAVEVEINARGGTSSTLTVERVIDCSGLQGDFTKLDRALVKQLLADGLIRADELRLGIEIAPNGAVIDAEGKKTPDFFAVGPITKGTFWEIVAVPDIRLACEQLAAYLYELPVAIQAAEDVADLPSADIVPLNKGRELKHRVY
jgi:uncharacterized NAD(P)/FAD-binding protein YdhS